MKKSVLVLGLVALFLTSCGEKKKEEVKKEVEAPVETVVEKTATEVVAVNLELGKKLFTEKNIIKTIVKPIIDHFFSANVKKIIIEMHRKRINLKRRRKSDEYFEKLERL